MTNELKFDPFCPNVLGAITGGAYVAVGSLQAAVGIFPHRAYLNQPVELVLILQNILDVQLDVKVAIQLPSRDANRSPMTLHTPRKLIDIGMKAGEVGILRAPIVAEPPTQPTTDIPVRVQFRQRPGRGGTIVRPPAGGAPPSVLAVSPFKLQALQDIDFVPFTSVDDEGTITTTFDLAPKQMPEAPRGLKPVYEVLWTMDQYAAERQNVRSKLEQARLLAGEMTRQKIYQPILRAVDETFAHCGLPLHPGEAKAIAKMITYTLDDTMGLEQTFALEDTRWFQTLCQVLAYDAHIARWEPGDIVDRYLFEAAIYDAVMVGFRIIRPRVRVDLGDRAERINYANNMLRWLGGQAEPDLNYIYLPLALGGVTVNHVVMGRDEDPWVMLDEMREAYRGRVRLAAGETVVIFDMLDKLLERGEDDLRRARVLRS